MRKSYICKMTIDNQKLESVRKYFSACPVLKAYLFGSYVRGEADHKSDVDILVELDYSQHIGLRFVQMQIELEKLLNNKVDLVSSQGISKHLQAIIDSEKKLIYAR